MARPARVSPDRILSVAALEFAERGFAGARVDRIARRARINKAMLYYHFKSKASLYRTLLRRTFSLAADRLRAIAASDVPPADKLDRAIEGIAALVAEHPVFPAIMLREIAEGGAHLDRATLAMLGALPSLVGGIVQEGVASGAFRPVNPVFAYFSMFAPIVRLRVDGVVAPVNTSGARSTPRTSSYRVTSHSCTAGTQLTGSSSRSRAYTGYGSVSSCSSVTVSPRLTDPSQRSRG